MGIKKHPPNEFGGCYENPANYLLSRNCNIIGSGCLTTVFGMGTGMARHLWSPGIRAGLAVLGTGEPRRGKDGLEKKLNARQLIGPFFQARRTRFSSNGERWLSRLSD